MSSPAPKTVTAQSVRNIETEIALTKLRLEELCIQLKREVFLLSIQTETEPSQQLVTPKAKRVTTKTDSEAA